MGQNRKDLVDQIAFYGAYHSNPWNQLIHIIFVPLIWWASVILLLTGLEYYINATTAYTVVYSIYALYVLYYLYLGDYPIAMSYNLILTCLFYHAKDFYETSDIAWKVALGAKLFGWWIQISIGHNHFEGRKPALLDSFFDAIVMAPLFTWYEVLFFLGFRKSFKKQVDIKIQKLIKQGK